MIFILTIMCTVVSLIIAGIAYGVQYAVEAQNLDFWYTWLYSFAGWVGFFILLVTYLGCLGRKRMRNTKVFLDQN